MSIIARKRPVNPNAAKALEDLKLEIANDLGISNSLNDNNYPANNIFTAGTVGGEMTRRLVENGEEQLVNENNNNIKENE